MLSPRDTQLGRGEPIRDTARVLARYLDCLVVRTFEHSKLEEMARFADVPVVNALTDSSHPCQLLADLLTVTERFGADALAKRRRSRWPGSATATTWRTAGSRPASLLGFDLRLACPEGYDPDPQLLARAGGRARVVRAPARGRRGRPRGEHRRVGEHGAGGEAEERKRRFAGYIVDEALMRAGAPGRDRAALPARPPRRGDCRGACSRGRSRPCSTRPRTGSTRRRRCSSCSSRADEARRAPTAPASRAHGSQRLRSGPLTPPRIGR